MGRIEFLNVSFHYPSRPTVDLYFSHLHFTLELKLFDSVSVPQLLH